MNVVALTKIGVQSSLKHDDRVIGDIEVDMVEGIREGIERNNNDVHCLFGKEMLG